MTNSANAYVVPPPSTARDLAEGGYGDLRSDLKLDEAGSSFAVLDTFDQEIRHSKRLLIESDGMVELISRTGPNLSQSAGHDGRFVADLHDGPVKDALADVSSLRSLNAVGTGEMRRGVLALMDDEAKTHARARLRILSAPGGDTMTVVVLQGLRGYDKALELLRKRIEAVGGQPLGDANAYTHLFADHATYEAKPEIAIDRDDPAFDAATRIISTYISVARANEAGTVADQDTEFLHDYRIALRKIRSVLSLFKGVYDAHQTTDLKQRFSKLMAPTGRLRDLDVYLLERQTFYDLLPGSLHRGLDRMFDHFAKERAAEHRKLVHWLQGKAYGKEITELEKLFSKARKLKRGPDADVGAHAFACKLIWNRYRKICKVASGIGPDTEDSEIHQLRIHCKKLRYLMEFFMPVFGDPTFKGLIKPLKKLQDTLGDFNDYAVQQVSLQNALTGLNGEPKAAEIEIAQAVGALISILHQKQLDERGKVVESFAQFNRPETQATFRALFRDRRGTA